MHNLGTLILRSLPGAFRLLLSWPVLALISFLMLSVAMGGTT